MCVCLLLNEIENTCVSLQHDYLNGKSILFSCKHMCGFPNVLVQEIQLCKALLISRHLEISLLNFADLMSAENIETLTFVSLKLCFLGFVHCHNELSFSYLCSFVHKFTS